MNMQEIGTLLEQGAALLRKVASERDEYKQKLASLEQKQRIEKLASEMRAKGINPHLSEEDLVKDLEKQAAEGRLDIISEAVSMSAGGTGNFNGIYDIAGGSVSKSEISGQALTAFLLTGNE